MKDNGNLGNYHRLEEIKGTCTQNAMWDPILSYNIVEKMVKSE